MSPQWPSRMTRYGWRRAAADQKIRAVKLLPRVTARILSALSAADVTAIFSKGLPAPTSPYSATLLSANQILLRQNGKYVFSSTLFNQTISAKSVTSMPINSSRTVDFLAERMPPERGGISITLKSVERTIKNENSVY
jgi:hypothetical protein